MKLDLQAFRYLVKGDFWLALWQKINQDDCWGRAAQLSYYFLLAFFPFLLFLSVLIAFIPIGTDPLQPLPDEMDRFLPERTSTLVREVLSELTSSLDSRATGVLSMGIVLALWSASLGFSGMTNVLNQSYQVEETRSYIRVRSLAVLVTIVVSVFVILSEVLLLFGGWLIKLALMQLNLGTFYTVLWQVVRWTLIFLFLNLGIQIVYFVLPARRFPWRLVSPGGVAAASGWIFGSTGFTFYVNSLADYQRLYGGLAGLFVLMIWFYISSLLLLLGGEMDSTIYRMRRADESATG